MSWSAKSVALFSPQINWPHENIITWPERQGGLARDLWPAAAGPERSGISGFNTSGADFHFVPIYLGEASSARARAEGRWMHAENRSDVYQVISTCGITHHMWEGENTERHGLEAIQGHLVQTGGFDRNREQLHVHEHIETRGERGEPLALFMMRGSK